MVNGLTFDDLTRANRRRCEKWHPGFPNDDTWSLADWSNAMCGEAGEAANVVKKIRRIQTGLSGRVDPPSEELKVMLGEELADVICYLDLLATKAGIDLPAAIVAKFNAISIREGFSDRLSS